MKYIAAILFFLACTSPQAPDPLPTKLEDCDCYEDSVYVIDFWSYQDGRLKPPCSMSPDYRGCMLSRGIVIR
jgi:hypothetical protein